LKGQCKPDSHQKSCADIDLVCQMSNVIRQRAMTDRQGWRMLEIKKTVMIDSFDLKESYQLTAK
jgi:hypothetical protein